VVIYLQPSAWALFPPIALRVRHTRRLSELHAAAARARPCSIDQPHHSYFAYCHLPRTVKYSTHTRDPRRPGNYAGLLVVVSLTKFYVPNSSSPYPVSFVPSGKTGSVVSVERNHLAGKRQRITLRRKVAEYGSGESMCKKRCLSTSDGVGLSNPKRALCLRKKNSSLS